MHLCRSRLGLLVLAGIAFPRAAFCSEVVFDVFPRRPIRLVVGFPVGDGVDVITRHLTRYMSNYLGQRVIVDKRPGAGVRPGRLRLASNDALEPIEVFIDEDTERWTDILIKRAVSRPGCVQDAAGAYGQVLNQRRFSVRQ
jgi:hypothetical protein